MTKRFSVEQIVTVLKHPELRLVVADMVCALGVNTSRSSLRRPVAERQSPWMRSHRSMFAVRDFGQIRHGRWAPSNPSARFVAPAP
jgi:hypothetical protein